MQKKTMNISKKVVTEIPVNELWNHNELIKAKRERYLSKDELTEILMRYPVEFVIANIGDDLNWIPVDKCFENWKSKLKAHVVNNLAKIELGNFPNGIAYIASEWISQNQTPIILLEVCH